MLAGHSRGGKLSALVAAEEPRVVALCLIDAVDNTVRARFVSISILFPCDSPILPQSDMQQRIPHICLLKNAKVYAPLAPGFPSALEALKALPRSASLPVAVIGSGLGGGCAPSEANYTQFFEACNGPTMEVDIRDAGQGRLPRSLPISASTSTSIV